MKTITMKKRFILFTGLTGLLLTACTAFNGSPNASPPVHDPVTQEDHATLARFYQQASQTTALKAATQQKLLAQYQKEGNSEEGKQVENWEDHARRLIIHYQELSRENAALARIHQDIASELASQPPVSP